MSEWLSGKEAIEASGINKRTFIRRVEALEKRDPELYEKLVDDSGPRKRYKGEAFVAFIQMDPRKWNPEKNQPIPVEQVKTAKKTSQATGRKPKRRAVTNKTTEQIKDILQESVTYEMDEVELGIYESLKTEIDRLRFEKCVHVMQAYATSPLTLQDCCRHHRITYDQFAYWAKKIPAVSDLLERIKIVRGDKLKDDEIDFYKTCLRKSAEGYDIEGEIKDQVVMRDMSGEETFITLRVRKQTKHVAAKPIAAIAMLKSLDPANFSHTGGTFGSGKLPEGNQPGGGRPDPLLAELKGLSEEELVQYVKDADAELAQLMESA